MRGRGKSALSGAPQRAAPCHPDPCFGAAALFALPVPFYFVPGLAMASQKQLNRTRPGHPGTTCWPAGHGLMRRRALRCRFAGVCNGIAAGIPGALRPLWHCRDGRPNLWPPPAKQVAALLGPQPLPHRKSAFPNCGNALFLSLVRFAEQRMDLFLFRIACKNNQAVVLFQCRAAVRYNRGGATVNRNDQRVAGQLQILNALAL